MTELLEHNAVETAPDALGVHAPDALSTALAGGTAFLTELRYGGRRFAFSRELPVRVLEEEGGWAFEADIPELVGFGNTRLEAEHAFRQDFAACWDHFTPTDDGDMTKGAVKLKRDLLALAREV
jgi:hypothetical protein